MAHKFVHLFTGCLCRRRNPFGVFFCCHNLFRQISGSISHALKASRVSRNRGIHALYFVLHGIPLFLKRFYCLLLLLYCASRVKLVAVPHLVKLGFGCIEICCDLLRLLNQGHLLLLFVADFFIECINLFFKRSQFFLRVFRVYFRIDNNGTVCIRHKITTLSTCVLFFMCYSDKRRD